MEGTHNLYTGQAQLSLSPEELEQFSIAGEISAFHPGMGKRVDIYKISVRNTSGREGPANYPATAGFDPNGNLSIDIPVQPGSELVLPITIPYEEIRPSSHTDYYFGKVGEKAGEIIVAAVTSRSQPKGQKSPKKTRNN